MSEKLGYLDLAKTCCQFYDLGWFIFLYFLQAIKSLNSLMDGCTQESRDQLNSKPSHQQQVYVYFQYIILY